MSPELHLNVLHEFSLKIEAFYRTVSTVSKERIVLFLGVVLVLYCSRGVYGCVL